MMWRWDTELNHNHGSLRDNREYQAIIDWQEPTWPLNLKHESYIQVSFNHGSSYR